MADRTKYRTKQRDVLLDFLTSSPGAHLTAADVCAYMKAQGLSIGQATIYRQLESLVDEGVLNKYIIDGTSPACFEYMPADSHCGARMCFHCKCEKCGRLIHLHCDELEGLGEHLLKDHQFRLDAKRTVFYGVCEACAGQMTT